MMYNTFNGVAMVFASDNMRTLLKIGFLIGLFIVTVQYFFELKFPLYSILVAYIVTAIMFIPKDIVVIEDIYSGQVYTVANVPLGIALPMSIVSTIGVNTTQLYETVFSTPDEAHLLESGYLQPLSTLVKLRDIGLGTASSDISFNGSLSDSLNQYIQGCVMYDINLEIPASEHEVTKEKLLKADNLWAVMKTSFINKDILIDLPGFSGQVSCNDGYDKLDKYINDPSFIELWDQYMRGLLDIRDPSLTPEDVVKQSTDALGIASVDAQTFMRNALMAAYLRDGPSAFIERTGIEQLRLQWSGEQSIFNQISRPLTAFIEIFTVAISPIVAFLTSIGLMGIKTITRYLQMLIWIALWGPITAVCNLYIAMVTTRIMDTVAAQAAANGTSLMAMVSHDRLYGTLETWLSTGGMLASSVPALSLMLVYGGSVAATNLAGRMTSGASAAVKPERLMPEPVSMGSTINVGSQRDFSANIGQSLSGVSQPTWSLNNTVQKAQQSTTTSLQSAQSGVSQAFNALNQHTDRHGNTVSDTRSITDRMGDSHSSVDQWTRQTARQIAEGVTDNKQQQETIMAQTAAQLGLAINTGKGYLPLTFDLGGKGSLNSTASENAQLSRDMSDRANKLFQTNIAGTDQFNKAHENAMSHQDQNLFGSEEMKQKGETYQQQLQRLEQAQQAYQETATNSQLSGKNLSMDYSTLAAKLMTSGASVDLANKERNILQFGSEQEKSEYLEAKENARKEIVNSGAIPSDRALMGDGYQGATSQQTLARFLALDSVKPEQALDVINDNLLPTNKRENTSLSPDSYKQNAQNVNEIVSEQQAKEFGSRAIGNMPTVTPNSGNQTNRTRSNDGSSNGNTISTDRTKFQLSAPTRNRDAEPGGDKFQNARQEVENALKGVKLDDPDKFRQNILNTGGKIDPKQDTSHLLPAATANEKHLVNDNVVKPVKEAMSDPITQSIDEAERIYNNVTGNRHKSDNDLPRIPADNDLPPTPKD